MKKTESIFGFWNPTEKTVKRFHQFSRFPFFFQKTETSKRCLSKRSRTARISDMQTPERVDSILVLIRCVEVVKRLTTAPRRFGYRFFSPISPFFTPIWCDAHLFNRADCRGVPWCDR